MTRRCLLWGAWWVLAATAAFAQQAPAEKDRDRQLLEAKRFLAAQDYPRAEAALAALTAAAEAPPEARYLHAVALQQQERLDDALAALARLEAAVTPGTADRDWRAKGRFLQAQIRARRREFAPAEAVFTGEAERLFSRERKEELAHVFMGFARLLETPAEGSSLTLPARSAPPAADVQRAVRLYESALEFEVGPPLREEILFRKGFAESRLGQHPRAANTFETLLAEFDLDWRRQHEGADLPTPAVAGRHVLPVRQALAESLLALGQTARARLELENLLAVLTAAAGREQSPAPTGEAAGDGPTAPDRARLTAEARFLMPRCFGMPQPGDNAALELGLAALDRFLALHPGDPRTVLAAWQRCEALRARGQTARAAAALQAFIGQEGFTVNPPVAGIGDATETPAERYQTLKGEALFLLGALQKGQRAFDVARRTWQRYLTEYPQGARWRDVQQQLVELDLEECFVPLAANDTPAAERALDAFLARHPLDGRAPQIMFLQGGIPYQEAVKAWNEAEGQGARDQGTGDGGQGTGSGERNSALSTQHSALPLFEEAVRRWQKLTEKYPQSDEAQRAHFEIGDLADRYLGQWERAIESFGRAQGNWRGQAQARIAELRARALELVTLRPYRLDETPAVTLRLRNLAKVSVEVYRLDIEEYFRKTLGLAGIEALDLALIAPDAQFEYAVDGYEPYRLFDVAVPIPFEGAGACAVHVRGEDLEATTLVLRSNLEALVKCSRKEVLVLVTDVLAARPVPEARVLVAAGGKVIAEGTTGSDGVYRGTGGQASGSRLQASESRGRLLGPKPEARSPKPEASPQPQASSLLDALAKESALAVFVTHETGIAASGLDLSGLRASTGLARKGFLMTDRPAYLPGERVYLRGVVREVKDGAYAFEEGAAYDLRVLDAAGRQVFAEGVKLSSFGSFQTEFGLGETAATGAYTITLTVPEAAVKAGRPGGTFTGRFQVEAFTLEKIKLAFEFDAPVLFRGETVKGRAIARYYYGAPAEDRRLELRLPDGRRFDRATDAAGTVPFEFDTTAIAPGRELWFFAQLTGENVSARDKVFLAEFGYQITLSTSQPTALVDEPVTLTARSIDPAGEGVSRTFTVRVLRRKTVPPSEVLAMLPALTGARAETAEVEIERHEVATNEQGRATLVLRGAEPGAYVLRAEGRDRFDQPITAETAVTVTGEDEAPRLSIDAESSTLPVGAPARVVLRSRLAKALALVTEEGEEVLRYRLVELQPGRNELTLDIEHRHFPNFALAAAVMAPDEKQPRQYRLFSVSHAFEVERRLKVRLELPREVYRPGEEATVTLSARDHLDRPVAAELALAATEQALFDRFPDRLPKLEAFFQEGARRQAEFATAASCGFRYAPATRRVAQGLLEEQARLESEKRESEALSSALRQLAERAPQGRNAWTPNPPANAEEAEGWGADQDEVMDLLGGMPAPSAAPPAPGEPMADGAIGGSGGEGGRALSQGRQGRLRRAGGGARADAPADKAAAASREEFLGTWAFWQCPVVTDAEGRATVRVPLPDKITQFRLGTRGWSVDTLVGEADAALTVRKDFFVEARLPSVVMEGDEVRPIVRVHNMTDFAGEAEVVLRALVAGRPGDAETPQEGRRAVVALRPKAMTEVTLDAVRVLPGEQWRVMAGARASAKLTDVVSIEIPIRPWGLELAVHQGGQAEGERTVLLSLPEGREYTRTAMVVKLSPSADRTLLDWTEGGGHLPYLRPAAGGSDGASELLGTASVLGYLREAQAPEGAAYRRLRARAADLVAALVSGQQGNGSWSWTPATRGGSDDAAAVGSTVMALWALARAQQEGVGVDAGVLDRGGAFLDGAFRAAHHSDNERKALIQFGLSRVGRADYAIANRLYRERAQLSNLALAHLSLALVGLDHKPVAKEVLDVLTRQMQQRDGGVFWAPRSAVPQDEQLRLSWPGSPVETTALALLALQELEPQSPFVGRAVQYLLAQRGYWGYSPARDNGPALAALAAYYRRGRFADADYRVKIVVNGREVAATEVKGEAASLLVEVPGGVLRAGENRVEFQKQGRGQYAFAATLVGFTPETERGLSTLPALRPWPRVFVHPPLLHRGRQLPPSTTKITKVEHGGTAVVALRLRRYWEQRANVPFLIIEDQLPAGCTLVEDSIAGPVEYFEQRGGRLTFFLSWRAGDAEIAYRLAGVVPGRYRVLPVVVRDAFNPGGFAVATGGMGAAAGTDFEVLAPGETSNEAYEMNQWEHWELARLLFEERDWAGALEHLRAYEPLLSENEKARTRKEVARMLLWIYTEPGFYDARGIVAQFEYLKEHYADLTVPFAKTMIIGRAYRDLGEFERAWILIRAVVTASFLEDTAAVQVLRREQEPLAAVELLEQLFREYPDEPETVAAQFGLTQELYQLADRAASLSPRTLADLWTEGPGAGTGTGSGPGQGAELSTQHSALSTQHSALTRAGLLARVTAMLTDFLARHADDPLGDDAGYSLVNASVELKGYEAALRFAGQFGRQYPKSDFEPDFRYLAALSLFQLHRYDEAAERARSVAEGKTGDRDLARYILGQIAHARQNLDEALTHYRQVERQFPDARESIAALTATRLEVPEVTRVPADQGQGARDQEQGEEAPAFRPGSFTREAANAGLQAGAPQSAIRNPQSGAPVRLKITTRNLTELRVQVYKIDLMTLYLQEKSLARMSRINLAGVRPVHEQTVPLDARPYRDHEETLELALPEVGAYLVLCRGGDRFASGVVVVSPLELRIEEDEVSGRVRVNVFDRSTDAPAEGVHVKVIGSDNEGFFSGETDLRGIVIADGIRGTCTVIAQRRRGAASGFGLRATDDRAGATPTLEPGTWSLKPDAQAVHYAFHRGEQVLARRPTQRPAPTAAEPDYYQFQSQKNRAMQQENQRDMEQRYQRARKGGIEAEDAR